MEIFINKKSDEKEIKDFIKSNKFIVNRFYLSKVNADEIIENELNNYLNNGERIVKYLYNDDELKCIYSLEQLDWDQKIFNKNMWKMKILTNSRLTSQITSILKEDIFKESINYKIEHISCQVKAKDYNNTYNLENIGFRIVDSIIRFGINLNEFQNYRDESSNELIIREYMKEDYTKIVEVGTEAFSNYPNRFLNEGIFSKEQCDRMYVEWLKNSIHGFADLLLVAESKNKISGFSTLKNRHVINDKEYIIAERQISAVSNNSRGLGINTKILEKQLQLASKYADFFEVGTQIYNYISQKTYYKCGLKPIDSYYSFHLSL